MRHDSNFYLELSLCHEWGIPHSEFLEWDNDDQAKAIAFVITKADKCEMCGTSTWEWEENRRAYEPIEKFCHGCYIKTVAGTDNSEMPGTTIELVPTGTVEHAKRIMKQRQRAAREARKNG